MSKAIDTVKSNLSDSITKVKNGDISPETGRSIAYIACKHIAAIKLEIEYAKIRGEKPEITELK